MASRSSCSPSPNISCRRNNWRRSAMPCAVFCGPRISTKSTSHRPNGSSQPCAELARTLPEPAATLLGYVNDRDVARLGPQLQPYIGFYVDAPALSPSRSPAPSVPVFLLHGRDDNVIPAAESQHMADRLRGHAPVRLLLTDLISHAAADQPAHVTDVLRLAGFWGDLRTMRCHARGGAAGHLQ